MNKTKKVTGVSFIVTILLLTSVATLGMTSAAETLPTIRICSDGTVDPTDAPIHRNGDVYTFTDNIHATMVVAKENVVIDGAGYTLQGTYNGTRTDSWVVGQGPDQELSSDTLWTIGLDFDVVTRPNNVTIKNLNIQNFYIGMYVWTSENIVQGNAVADNIVGILLSGDSNNITENYVARNDEGVFFGVNTPGNEPLDIVLAHNSFIDNKVQFSGCFCETYNTEEAVHTWDDGGKGNYWSDYNGTDHDGDGIGDTPYVIDILNEDRYPLMQVLAVPPKPSQGLSSEVVTVVALVVVILVVIAVAVVFRKRRRQSPQT